jgi:uncharacterized SAM-binding protein YcdF (DUF218 family)
VKNFFKVLAFIVVTLGILVAVMFFSLGFYLSPQSTLSKSDAIVAISGGETRSRTLEAIRIYKEGWAPKLIFSGAALDPNSPSNAEAMQRIAIENGVPAEDILLDETAANTNGNAAGVASIVQDQGYKKIILVTSPYHQRRASVTFARKLPKDVAILNHSTTDENWRRSAWWANDYSKELTIAELQKTLFVVWSER